LFAEALREAQSANKDLNRQVSELTALRVALEGERDALAIDLADTRDAYKDVQARLDAANNALSQLRSEMEHRLREKDEELENVRKSGQRALDELQRTIVEIETRYKGELSRLKKKYESEIQEFEIQIETLSRTNAELAHANKSLSGKVKVRNIEFA
jgi:chromosome segregation ATPase